METASSSKLRYIWKDQVIKVTVWMIKGFLNVECLRRVVFCASSHLFFLWFQNASALVKRLASIARSALKDLI